MTLQLQHNPPDRVWNSTAVANFVDRLHRIMSFHVSMTAKSQLETTLAVFIDGFQQKIVLSADIEDTIYIGTPDTPDRYRVVVDDIESATDAQIEAALSTVLSPS